MSFQSTGKMNTHTSNLTIPNLLSGLRLASVPVLLLLAWRSQPNLYLICLAISLSTDLIDGALARLLRQQTDLGAKLDLWGDVGVLLSLPIALWWLWPDVLHREQWFIGATVACYAVSAGFASWKFGHPATYHTWCGKTFQTCLCLGTFVTLLGWADWPLRVGLILLNAAILEEIAISMVLTHPRSNVPSWWHARTLARSATQAVGQTNSGSPKTEANRSR